MKKINNQIIVSASGHSWLGFWSADAKLNASLKEICELSQSKEYRTGSYRNAFWVLDFNGSCVAAQPSLNGALRYYNDDRILVHYQPSFV